MQKIKETIQQHEEADEADVEDTVKSNNNRPLDRLWLLSAINAICTLSACVLIIILASAEINILTGGADYDGKWYADGYFNYADGNSDQLLPPPHSYDNRVSHALMAAMYVPSPLSQRICCPAATLRTLLQPCR